MNNIKESVLIQIKLIIKIKFKKLVNSLGIKGAEFNSFHKFDEVIVLFEVLNSFF